VNGADRSVVVSRHALDRARLRFGSRVEWQEIHADVVAALHASRISCRVPRFVAGTRSRWKAHKGARFVWTEDETRLYVIRPYQRDTHWKVITSLRPFAIELEELCSMPTAA
jgi:hypothetical protein